MLWNFPFHIEMLSPIFCRIYEKKSWAWSKRCPVWTKNGPDETWPRTKTCPDWTKNSPGSNPYFWKPLTFKRLSRLNWSSEMLETSWHILTFSWLMTFWRKKYFWGVRSKEVDAQKSSPPLTAYNPYFYCKFLLFD